MGAGIFAGGFYGARVGYKTSPSPRFWIRVNSVMNGAGKLGSKFGNNAGVIGECLIFRMFMIELHGGACVKGEEGGGGKGCGHVQGKTRRGEFVARQGQGLGRRSIDLSDRPLHPVTLHRSDF